jgi:large subunit ribosomal protein L31
MKSNVHPTWYSDAKVTCACGNSFTTGSTLPEITVDICSTCHPFFTGEMRFVDRQGRVDKFMQKMQAAQAKQAAQAAKQGKNTKATPQSNEPVKSYQTILREQQQKIKTQKKAE